MTEYYISNDENDVIKSENGSLFRYRYGTEGWEPVASAPEMHRVDYDGALAQIDKNREMYDRLLTLADRTAEKAHEGQYCMDGSPYITHPRTVASFLGDTEHKIIALLHDTIEDTDMTAQRLSELGFTKRIVDSVSALTRSEDKDYLDYIRSLKSAPNARYVKTADLKHNMDITRIPNPTQHDYDRIEKYKKAKEIIDSWD